MSSRGVSSSTWEVTLEDTTPLRFRYGGSLSPGSPKALGRVEVPPTPEASSHVAMHRLIAATDGLSYFDPVATTDADSSGIVESSEWVFGTQVRDRYYAPDPSRLGFPNDRYPVTQVNGVRADGITVVPEAGDAVRFAQDSWTTSGCTGEYYLRMGRVRYIDNAPPGEDQVVDIIDDDLGVYNNNLFFADYHSRFYAIYPPKAAIQGPDVAARYSPDDYNRIRLGAIALDGHLPGQRWQGFYTRVDKPQIGPVDVTGRTVAVSGWGPGGREETAVPETLVFVLDGGSARLGTAALALLGLVEHVGRDPGQGRRARLAPLVRGLVEFILMMQREDGSFQSHFVVKDHGLTSIDEPGDAGMALLALARASALIEEPRIEPALERGLAAHARLVEAALSGGATPTACTRLAGHVPWMAFAAAQAGDLVPAAADATGQGVRVLASGCLITAEQAPSAGLAGGHLGGGMPGARDVLAAAASAEALLAGPAGDQDARVHEKALELGLQLALRLVVTPGVNDHFLPAPGRAAGGVGRDLVDHRQRLDASFAVVALLTRLVR